MKHFKQTVLTLGLAAATSLFLTGCKDGTHASHDGHDHAGHDHASETAKAAGTAVDAATAGTLIEAPTAEQVAAAKPYPLKTCLVSDEELGSMGDPLVMVFGEQQIKFCCKNCPPDFKKEPAKYLSKLAATK